MTLQDIEEKLREIETKYDDYDGVNAVLLAIEKLRLSIERARLLGAK